MDYFSIDEAAEKLSVSPAILLDRIRQQKISAHIELPAGTRAVVRATLPFEIGFIRPSLPISSALADYCTGLGSMFERWHLFPVGRGGEFIDNLYLAAACGMAANAKRVQNLGIFVGSLVEDTWYVYELGERINESFVAAEKFPTGAQLKISEEEILAFLNTQRAEPAADARPSAETVAIKDKRSRTQRDDSPARLRIQQEATEEWIRWLANGGNPRVHSICEPIAKWCARNQVTLRGGVCPRAGTLRNTVLGAKHWTPPTLSREQAKAHVARVAQDARRDVAQDARGAG